MTKPTTPSDQLAYLVTLLPVSALNRPDVMWRKGPDWLVLTKNLGSLFYDRFTVQWMACDGTWEILADRFIDFNATGEPDSDDAVQPLPLRQNATDIATLHTLVTKMEQRFAPAAQVVTLGTMSFEPVEGEPDYVERVSCSCGRACACVAG